MHNKKISLRENPISFILFPLLVGVGIVSYYRFFVYKDYMVSYNTDCDPAKNVCFIECEDLDCNEHIYYYHINKYAPDVYKQCGNNIKDCSEAKICLATDLNCSVEYCNPDIKENLCTDPKEFIPAKDINLKEKNI